MVFSSRPFLKFRRFSSLFALLDVFILFFGNCNKLYFLTSYIMAFDLGRSPPLGHAFFDSNNLSKCMWLVTILFINNKHTGLRSSYYLRQVEKYIVFLDFFLLRKLYIEFCVVEIHRNISLCNWPSHLSLGR